MRRHVAALLAGVCLAPLGAHAQDATWLANPPGSDFNSAANWTPPTVPTGTAFFGPSTQANLGFSAASTTLGGLTFNANAPAYSFGISDSVITLTGAGLVNNAANIQPLVWEEA